MLVGFKAYLFWLYLFIYERRVFFFFFFFYSFPLIDSWPCASFLWWNVSSDKWWRHQHHHQGPRFRPDVCWIVFLSFPLQTFRLLVPDEKSQDDDGLCVSYLSNCIFYSSHFNGICNLPTSTQFWIESFRVLERGLERVAFFSSFL